MNEAMTQILNAATPILCLLITAGGAYLVALLKRQTAQIEKDLDNETATKYMNMAVDAVAQAVAYTAQTFADSLKAEGKFTKEKQLEAFEKSKTRRWRSSATQPWPPSVRFTATSTHGSKPRSSRYAEKPRPPASPRSRQQQPTQQQPRQA